LRTVREETDGEGREDAEEERAMSRKLRMSWPLASLMDV
jgi:hypothetical protein